jgi:hypothetical protein
LSLLLLLLVLMVVLMVFDILCIFQPARYSVEFANIHDRLFHEGKAREQEKQQEVCVLLLWEPLTN